MLLLQNKEKSISDVKLLQC